MRIIVYTGKGGVGKTSMAAATALRASELGHRTLVLSTDLAHSLGDSFDTRLGPEPTQLAPLLWGQEPDVHHNMQTHWGVIQEWLKVALTWRGGVDGLVADEVSIIPGMEELSNLLCIDDHRASGTYDVLVVDAAPTGETLRLLSLPDALRWWIEQIFPMYRRGMKVVRPLVRALTDAPTPPDKVFGSVLDLFHRLDQLHHTLVDPQLTSIRLILNPEKMVVAEAQRTYTYLSLFGYPTDLVVANRIVPSDVMDPYFAAWKDAQAAQLEKIREGFQPLHVKTVPLFGNEMMGLDALRCMATAAFGSDDDPTRRFSEGRTSTIELTSPHSYRLAVPVPFATRGEIHVSHNGDELFIQVGSFRHRQILPRTLAGLNPSGARLDEESHLLTVRFDQVEPVRK
jgi:arsenite/tail-anchored protein-transporting ATPase